MDVVNTCTSRMEFISYNLTGKKTGRWSVPSASLYIIKAEETGWYTRWLCYLRRDLDRLEKRAERNLTKSNTG